MKRYIRPLLVAASFVAFLFSLPMWLPGLLVQNAAAKVDPNPSESPLIILDGGWFTGQTQYHVIAVPQVLAWDPGASKATWATETGFLYGGLINEGGTLIYVIEHRKIGLESLSDQTFDENELYRNNTEWGVFLTKLDPKTGRTINRAQLPDPPIKDYSDVSLIPLAVNGDTLYLQNHAEQNNLFVYDMKSGSFSKQAFSACEHGYMVRSVFLEKKNGVASLCTDYHEKTMSWITIVSLSNGDGRTIEIPKLGEDDFETGNGLILTPTGELIVIDTDAGVLAKLDTETMRLSQPLNYLQGLDHQPFHRILVDWLLGLGAQPAYAKRWMSLSAISPDGHWLAVDSGLGNVAINGGKPGVAIIDLTSMQANYLIELDSTPSNLVFGADENLFVFFQKNSIVAPQRGIQIDLTNGTQTAFDLQLNGWLHSILSTP